MAKVLLIQPHNDLTQLSRRENSAPITLIYLATYIKNKHEVKIYDRNLHEGDSEFLYFLKKFSPDIIGFQSKTCEMLYDIMHLGPKIKEELPDCLLIVGGNHATLEPDSVLNESYVDYIVRGEGEEVLLEICNIIDKAKAKTQKKEQINKLKNINKNPTRPFLDVNKLAPPDYELCELKKYTQFHMGTTRGCPGECSFCGNVELWGINGKPCIRPYNVEKTIELFKELIEKYGIKVFNISDDDFLVFRRRCLEVCNFLQKRHKGDISFMALARADYIVNNEMCVKPLKKAGCHTIQMGIESGSQRVLNFLNKNISIATQAKSIEICKKAGLIVDASFMIGLPTETVSELMMTKRFIEKYKPDIADVKIFNPYPGTKVYNDLIEQGKIKPPKNLLEWAEWTGTLREIKNNFSEIPDELLWKTANEMWGFNYYRARLKKALYWIRKGEIKYTLKQTRRLLIKGYKNIGRGTTE